MLSRILVSIVLLVACPIVSARWATFEDAPIKILTNDLAIDIKSNGTCEIIVTKKIQILNENGREANAKLPLYYNNDNSRLEILQAKTINAGKEYELSKNLIEDKPLASEVHGFDQTHQVLLAFPNVKVGSIIYFKYKLKLFKAEIPGFFEAMYDFDQVYIENKEIHIKSELPLYINSNNPDKYLLIKQGKVGKTYTLDVTLQKPIYINIADEKSNLINPAMYPWVYVATSDNWAWFLKNFDKPYSEVLQQPLPELYQNILNEAAQQSNAIKKIEVVSALLNEHIQYMGDWKTTKGRHVPQNLVDVAIKRLGDCKDFATGMVAILRKLGIDANVSLVQRGTGVYDTSIVSLPGGFHFNHAMVRVVVDNKVLWVDPTNFMSIADKILPDIADREVIVLDAKNSRLEHIPQSNAQDNVMTIKRSLDVSNSQAVSVNTTVSLHGLSAVDYTGAGLRVSKDTIDNTLIYYLGNYENITDKKVIAPDLTSRIVKDLNFKVEYKEKNMLMNSNAGSALLINSPVVGNFIFSPDQVSDIYLGPPNILEKTTIINNVIVSQKKNLDHKLESPWLDLVCTVKYGKNSVVIYQKATIKTSWLYNKTIKTKEYQLFATELAEKFNHGIAIVFDVNKAKP